MRKFLECFFLVLFYIKLNILLIACQQPETIDSDLRNEVDSNYVNETINFNKMQVLTPVQLAAVFPEQLGGLKKTDIQLDQITGSATAIYGSNKFEIKIIDDLKNHYSNIYLFNKKYRKPDKGEVGEKIIRTVRDGYKTIATIDESGITSIVFVFKHRYLFNIKGNDKQTPYMVWRFLELNKLQKLQ